jgi:hypothetical protein
LSTVAAAEAYLTIPPGYGAGLEGVHWSLGCDAIEDANGETLVLFEQLVDVLEGVFARPSVSPFAYVLHALTILKRGGAGPFDRLRRAYAQATGAPALSRNVGTLISELAGFVGRMREPAWRDLNTELHRRRRDGEHRRPELAVEPPLSPAQFEASLADGLARYDDAALVHWLTAAAPPSGAGEELVRPIASLPDRVREVLRLAVDRPRLAGAAALAPALDAALTMPARRRSPDRIPQGGYADVTTRGELDRLLPSQFALDPDDFVRRFAERELLYFRREDPHTAPKPERVIVLDQGVRTWGSVRHALTAAALVLLGKDPKRNGPVRLVTGGTDFADRRFGSTEALAKMLETSDLTPHPADGLGRVFDEPPDGLRDVILLTHPRNLIDPSVTAAAKRRHPTDRLYALAVDADGQAELAEWTRSGRLTVRQFRVDLVSAEAAVDRAGTPTVVKKKVGDWTGDVEPVPFPFRPGTVGDVAQFGFDTDGEWLVYAGQNGTLHSLEFDGGPPTVLPRAFKNGSVLQIIHEILPVRGGVAVCGTMTPPPRTVYEEIPTIRGVVIQSPLSPVMTSFGTESDTAIFPRLEESKQYVVAHYDRALKSVRVHTLGPATTPVWFRSFPAEHAVAAVGIDHLRTPTVIDGTSRFVDAAVDLDSGVVRYEQDRVRDRAHRAVVKAVAEPVWIGHHRLRTEPSSVHDHLELPYVYVKDCFVHVRHAVPSWKPFRPTKDGQPRLAEFNLTHARLDNDVVTLAGREIGTPTFLFFRGPDGAGMSVIHEAASDDRYQVSPNGRRIAYVREKGNGVVVADTAGGPDVAYAYPAKVHSNLDIAVSTNPFRLLIRSGDYVHRIREGDSGLLHDIRNEGPNFKLEPGESVSVLEYDRQRFPQSLMKRSGLLAAVVDRMGQVVLTKLTGEVVAVFHVRREKLAAWIPDGTFWGDPALIGGPQTLGAAGKVADAIFAAARGES